MKINYKYIILYLVMGIQLCVASDQTTHSQITDCDLLAASKSDPNKITEGVDFKDLNAVTAIAACKKAVAEKTNSARLNFQYGRALYKAKDYAEALKWYRKAAEQGYAIAQFNLGKMHGKGIGIAQDYAEAVKWHRKAAEQGYAPAQSVLGFLYYRGKGVDKDKAEAVKWILLAAEQGDNKAKLNLGLMYDRGEVGANDRSKALSITGRSEKRAKDKSNFLSKLNIPEEMVKTYTAIVSCGMNGQNYNVLACFKETDLKITKNNRSTVYKIYNLQSAGKIYQDGLHVDLPKSFSIRAQNSQKHMVLGLKILDTSGKITYEDQAGMWNVVSAANP